MTAMTAATAVAPPSIAVVAEAPGPTEQPAGPVVVAGWEMNEASGQTQMVDTSGRGNHGAISPDAADAGLNLNGSYYDWSSRCRDCPPTALPRVVQVPDSPDLDIPDPNAGWSLEFRFKTKVQYGNLLQKGQATTPGGQIKVEDPVRLRCVFKGASGNAAAAVNEQPLNDGEWHTVACVHTATSVSQWVDGVLVAETTVKIGTIDNAEPFAIGGKTRCNQTSVGCDYYRGRIDWARITRG